MRRLAKETIAGGAQASALAAFLLRPSEDSYGRFHRAVERWGGSLVQKLAQLLSSQANFLDEAWRRRLREDFAATSVAAPEPWSSTRAALEEHLLACGDDGPASAAARELLAGPPRPPDACGSLAHIYFEADVAVKVLHANLSSEVRVLSRLARASGALLRAAGRRGVASLLEAAVRDLEAQADLRVELRNMRRAREELSGRVRVPDPYAASERVLCAELVRSGRLCDVDERARRRAAVDVVAEAELAMLRGVGFHADLHEGNIGVDAQGRTVLYDWGSATSGLGARGADFLRAYLTEDAEATLALVAPGARYDRRRATSGPVIVAVAARALDVVDAGGALDSAAHGLVLSAAHLTALCATTGHVAMHSGKDGASLHVSLGGLARVLAFSAYRGEPDARVRDFVVSTARSLATETELRRAATKLEAAWTVDYRPGDEWPPRLREALAELLGGVAKG